MFCRCCLVNDCTCAKNYVWMWHMAWWSSSICNGHWCDSSNNKQLEIKEPIIFQIPYTLRICVFSFRRKWKYCLWNTMPFGYNSCGISPRTAHRSAYVQRQTNKFEHFQGSSFNDMWNDEKNNNNNNKCSSCQQKNRNIFQRIWDYERIHVESTLYLDAFIFAVGRSESIIMGDNVNALTLLCNEPRENRWRSTLRSTISLFVSLSVSLSSSFQRSRWFAHFFFSRHTCGYAWSAAPCRESTERERDSGRKNAHQICQQQTWLVALSPL